MLTDDGARLRHLLSLLGARGVRAVRFPKVHPAELCRAIQPFLDRNPGATLVCDGGEIGQWAQACLSAPNRVINGVADANATIPAGSYVKRVTGGA